VIFDYFDEQFNDGEYTKFDNLKPVVSTEMNFDQVRRPRLWLLAFSRSNHAHPSSVARGMTARAFSD
jgi:hypothetical protein